MILGVDEVGRGPWAGPVVAAAVGLVEPIEGLDDSKKLSPIRRLKLAREIRRKSVIGFGAASVAEIDRTNILSATFCAMRRAVSRIDVPVSEILVDGNSVPDWPYPSRAIIGGDGRVAEISAASIVAKVLRDQLMQRLDRRYPGYDWAKNAGYGTRMHREGLKVLGVTAHHRRSFKPIAAILSNGAID